MIQTVDAALYKEMIISGAALLEQNKQRINDLNVFPVPDGDTGTNMSLTFNSGATTLKNGKFDTVTAVADASAGAFLRGARGNSGVIISLLFRGMSKSLKEKATITASDFAQALSEGVSVAYGAVMRPTEGTILTVSRLVADAAKKYAEDGDDFEDMFSEMIKVGEAALSGTTEQNPVLKKAGVVDAGGDGYLCILRGMFCAMCGEPVVSAESETAGESRSAFAVFTDEDITHTYCTEFIVNRENLKSPAALKDYLNGVGDSLVFVEDDEIIKVHVHTDVPGQVLTQALNYGSFVTVKVENMRLQHTEMIESASETAEDDVDESVEAAPEKTYGTVAVCAGKGIEDVFRNLGVDALVTGGQTMNPSTEDILKAIKSVPAATVFVFPNNKNIIMAAQQCDALTEKNVVIIPTKTVPQGITALINFDETMDAQTLTETLTESCENVHTALVTYAARDSEFDGMSIGAGEYLALLEGSLVGSDKSLSSLLGKLTDSLKEFDPEIITVYYGEDVDEQSAGFVYSKFGSEFPDAEATMINGGQPVYYYMISAE